MIWLQERANFSKDEASRNPETNQLKIYNSSPSHIVKLRDTLLPIVKLVHAVTEDFETSTHLYKPCEFREISASFEWETAGPLRVMPGGLSIL